MVIGRRVINVTVTGPGSFQGTIVSGNFANCPGVSGNSPGGVIWKQMSGAGFSYTGKIPWFQLPQCSPIGDGSTTFKLTSINSGTLTSTSPDGSKTESASMTRVGAWPGADAGGQKPKTNCKKNGKPVLCAKQKQVAKKVGRLVRKTAAAAKGFKAASVEKQSDKLGKLVDLAVQAGTLAGKWREQKLPKTKAQAKAKLDAAPLAKGYKSAKTTANLNSKLVSISDPKYDSDLRVRETLDRTALDRYGKVYSDLGEFDKAAVHAEAWKDPSPGGNELRIDPQTGALIFQTYGNSNQTGTTYCGEYLAGGEVLCRTAFAPFQL